MIEKEFNNLEKRIGIARTKKSLKLLLKMSYNKIRAIVKNIQITQEEKQKAISSFKKIKTKINIELTNLK